MSEDNKNNDEKAEENPLKKLGEVILQFRISGKKEKPTKDGLKIIKSFVMTKATTRGIIGFEGKLTIDADQEENYPYNALIDLAADVFQPAKKKQKKPVPGIAEDLKNMSSEELDKALKGEI